MWRLPKIVKLKNNLKVILYSSDEFITASILALVKTGTDYETKKLNGISHFVEHLFFKGSENFPSSKVLGLELDKIGASYNAFTSYEYTGYYIKTLPEYFERAVYLISDILCNPLFPEEEIEKERNVILEEINYHIDTPTSYIFDEVLKITFGDQPAGWSILGTSKNLRVIKREHILKYFKTHYTVNNTYLVLVGNFNQNRILKILNKFFEKYSNNKAPQKAIFDSKKSPKLKGKIYTRKDLKQAHILILFKTDGLKDLKDRRFALGVLTSLLGYGLSSRLFRILREELGITYYIKVDTDFYTDRGYFFIQTGCNLEKIENTLKRILEEFQKIKRERISDEEIEKSKAILESSLISTAESSLNLAYFYGIDYLIFNKFLSPNDYLLKIKKVKEGELKRELNKLITYDNLKFGILVPDEYKNLKIAKIFKKTL